MIEWVLIHWPSAVLIIIPLLAAHFCWNLREHMQPAAWLFFGVFVAMFFADNSWRLVPWPDPLTIENGRLWSQQVRLYYGIANGWCAFAAVAIAFYAAVTNQMKGATLLMLATVIGSMFGSHTEFTYCRLNDPVRGFDHVYLFEGGRNPACGRLVEFGVAPWLAWIGVWFAPLLTVAPSIVAMGWTVRRKQI